MTEEERKYNCYDCGKTSDCPMLHDDTWATIAKPTDHLCMNCAEFRLYRIITLHDLKNIRVNDPIRVMVTRALNRNV